MKTLGRIAVVLGMMGFAHVGRADAPLVFCEGTACGGHGPTGYAYRIDSGSYPMMEFRAGTNDLDRDHYTNVLLPEGWSFAVEEHPMSHAHGVHTPHGEVSPGPCWCLTAGSVLWWTDDPAFAVEFFTFGYDHTWCDEDLGWDLLTRREGNPPEYFTFEPFWDAPLGTGVGPAHGPYAPRSDLNGNGSVDQADLGILLRDWGCDDPINGCAGDIDGDDDTDQADLGMLLSEWGQGCR